MSFTYDPTSDVGKVRLLITDTQVSNPALQMFSDYEIQAYLDLETTVFEAAALALDTIATNEALVQKVIKTLDLETDGSKTAAVLMARAKALRERASDNADVVIADMVTSEFSRREVIKKDWEKNFA